MAAAPRTTNSHTNMQIRSYRVCRKCSGHMKNSDPFYLIGLKKKKKALERSQGEEP